jgi:hypothetical protein
VAPPADLGAANQDIEAILSTFELTTPAPTAGWKTYTNTEFGFEVKLPPNWSGYVVWTGPEHPGATGWVDILYYANAQVPGQAVRFIIYTPAQWNTELTYDQPHPIELGRSDIYVITTPFRFEYQGLPGEADIQSILSTFRFTK